MRYVAGNSNLDYERFKKPELLNLIIKNSPQGRKLLQFKADQKFKCQDYTFQEVVNSVEVEAIVAAIDMQYVKELKEE